MDPRLLRAYNDELIYLRETAREFGEEYENVAGRLGLKLARIEIIPRTEGEHACSRCVDRRAHVPDGAQGTENEKVAPGPSFLEAQMRPLCRSMMERLTDKPIPIPPVLVV